MLTNKSIMVTFLFILGGLITFNFILLKFSIQSVDTDRKKRKRTPSTTQSEISRVKEPNIQKAA